MEGGESAPTAPPEFGQSLDEIIESKKKGQRQERAQRGGANGAPRRGSGPRGNSRGRGGRGFDSRREPDGRTNQRGGYRNRSRERDNRRSGQFNSQNPYNDEYDSSSDSYDKDSYSSRSDESRGKNKKKKIIIRTRQEHTSTDAGRDDRRRDGARFPAPVDSYDPKCSILAKNFPKKIHMQDMLDLFKENGRVRNVSLNWNFKKSDQCSVYVEFETPEAAQQTKKKYNAAVIENRELQLETLDKL